MATPKGQRIGIWIIVIVMSIGTVGTYFALALGNANDEKQSKEQQAALDDYNNLIKEQAKANQVLSGYEVTKFDAASVTELKKEDLVTGEGAEVKLDDKVKVSYTGWTPDGSIFDSTTKNGTNTPAEFALSIGSLIEGWTSGIPGMKVGGVRKLTIPSEQAYRSIGSEPLIAPNTPLQFLVRIEAITN